MISSIKSINKVFRRLSAASSCVASSKRKMSGGEEDLKAIFGSAVEAVKPAALVRNWVSVEEGHLVVGGKNYGLQKPCRVVGFGKAVLGMAVELERILGKHLEDGVVVVPRGIFRNQKDISEAASASKIKFYEGAADNLPDEAAARGAAAIKDLAESLREDDLLVVLISGGGSALLPLPKEGISLQEKSRLIRELARRGADILELNSVRKRLSVLKGGGLAELAFPARVVALILSDIVGDPLDFIASGPTTVNGDEKAKAMEVLRKYSLLDEEIGQAAKNCLEAEEKQTNCAKGSRRQVPVDGGNYSHVDNNIIGNNRIAAEAAMERATSLGFQSAILSTDVCGDVSQIGEIYGELARNIANALVGDSPRSRGVLRDFLRERGGKLGVTEDAIGKITTLNFEDAEEGVCLIAGGEPTVVVKGGGKGGRNQQLALEFARQIHGSPSATISTERDCSSPFVYFLSCGTDGIDGPTDAAGAISTSDLAGNCLRQGINPEEHLENNDSYGFYSKYNGGKNLVKVGHTGTNVMDLHVLLVKPPS